MYPARRRILGRVGVPPAVLCILRNTTPAGGVPSRKPAPAGNAADSGRMPEPAGGTPTLPKQTATLLFKGLLRFFDFARRLASLRMTGCAETLSRHWLYIPR